MAGDQLMTVPEFGARIKVKPRTAYRIVARREVSVINVGSRKRPNLRVSEAALARYVKEHEIAA